MAMALQITLHTRHIPLHRDLLLMSSHQATAVSRAVIAKTHPMARAGPILVSDCYFLPISPPSPSWHACILQPGAVNQPDPSLLALAVQPLRFHCPSIDVPLRLPVIHVQLPALHAILSSRISFQSLSLARQAPPSLESLFG